MKLLWMSNARRAPSGYGNQTNLFVPALHKAGHPMTIFAFHGIQGAPMVDEDGITTLPPLHDGYGNDVIEAHMVFTQADALITLIDPWVLQPQVYGEIPWCAWAPIDCEPVLPANVTSLKAARWVWAMSKFGQEQLAAAGIESIYVPHGVDTELFKPLDRTEARERWGKFIKQDLTGKFVVVMNSANIGSPSRKGFSEAIEAFKLFSDDVPAALLYIHTDPEGLFYGENLSVTMKCFGLDPAKVIFPPQYPYRMGMLPGKYLNDVYNAADVFLTTSHGEGFGIPIVEAQAAGCPVIVTDFSAMSELCMTGWLVTGKKVMHVPGSMQCVPDVAAVEMYLHIAHQNAKSEYATQVRELARARALDYDYRTVLNEHMLPALERMRSDLDKAAEQAIAQPVAEPVTE